ncbi:MAG: hypothetical protein M1816_004923 [Peltula sp. TS41687]|nr:MAG: hypothetical protein M1816_004923 [Peltula sp. TS41687]
MALVPNSDPWNWSVQEVIDYLSHEFEVSTSETIPTTPDPVSLGERLREHRINGLVLLCNVDHGVLSNELGLNVFGPRTLTMHVIEALRMKSPMYQRYIFETALRAKLEGFISSSDLPRALKYSAEDATWVPTPTPILLEPDEFNADPAISTMPQPGIIPERLGRIDSLEANDAGASKRTEQASNVSVVEQDGKGRRRLAPINISGEVDAKVQNTGGVGSAVDVPGELNIGPEMANFTLPSNTEFRPAWQTKILDLVHEIERADRAKRRAEGEDLPEGLTDEEERKDAENPSAYLKHHLYQSGNPSKVYEPFGESGSENECDSATWNEMEQERLEQEERGELPVSTGAANNPRLSEEQIKAAIQEAVDKLLGEWKSTELPKRERKARRIWYDAKRFGTVKSQIDVAQGVIDKVEKVQLPGQQNHIASKPWTSKSQLQKLASVMQRSIFEREDARWKISVLSTDSPLPKPAPRARNPRVPRVARRRRRESQDRETDVDSISDEVLQNPVGARALVLEEDNTLPTDEADDEGADNSEGTDNDEVESSEQEDLPEGKSQYHLRCLLYTHGYDSAIFREPNTTGEEGLSWTCKGAHPVAICHRPDPLFVPPGEPIDLTRSSPDLQPGQESASARDIANSDSDENPFINPDAIDAQDQPGMHGEAPWLGEMAGPQATENDLQDELSDDGEHASDGSPLGAYRDINKITSRPPKYYEDRLDRKRLLINLLASSHHLRPWVANRMSTRTEAKLRRELLRVWKLAWTSKPPDPGMNNEAFWNLETLAKLYSQWFECKKKQDRVYDYAKVVSELGDLAAFHQFHQFSKQALSYFGCSVEREDNKRQTERVRQGDSMEPSTIGKGKRKKQMQPDSALRQASNSDRHHPKSKRRKRAINEDVHARKVREDDKHRLQVQESRKHELEKAFQETGRSLNEDPSQIMINIGKDESQVPIYINPRIGEKIKEHQIEGVRFMWREVVTKDEARRGCLLAHEMGLGKTMQVITLLVTIAEAARSPIQGIFEQVPEGLRSSRTLIICPAGLSNNWHDEILLWAPQAPLGRLSKIDSATSKPHRVREIAAWHEEGGILIISYHMFRDLILNNPTKGSSNPPIDSVTHERLKTQLFDGPTIVVADEAHHLKNENNSITVSASQFKTRSRIALTASPLANNLKEYFYTINWVAPGYLGPWGEFNAKYVDPIEHGIYKDSSIREMRRSLKMLHVLKTDLEPKVQRADVSVLKANITTKTEFVIRVPLTPLQKQAYTLFLRSLLSKGGSKAASEGLLDGLGILTLLCIHPQCLFEYLKTRQRTRSQSRVERRKLLSQEAANPIPISRLGIEDAELDDTHMLSPEPPEEILVDTFIPEQLALFTGFGEGLTSPTHSCSIPILMQILDAAAKAGDKCLIFTQRKPIMDYLANLLTINKRTFSRLDGHTVMSTRHKHVKDFNKNGPPYIYLLATRAGGLGINLPAANRVIIMDFHFNPAWETQAIGRAYRLGQKKPVYVYRFLAGGTIMDTVYNQALFKTNLATRVVDKRNPERMAEKDVKQYFFEPKEVPQEDLSHCYWKDPLVFDKILVTNQDAKIIRSITLSESYKEDLNDKLTAEEEVEVSWMIKEEQLKRTDPGAYKKWAPRPESNRPNLGATTSSAAKPLLGTDGKPISVKSPTQSISALKHAPLNSSEGPPDTAEHTKRVAGMKRTLAQAQASTGQGQPLEDDRPRGRLPYGLEFCRVLSHSPTGDTDPDEYMTLEERERKKQKSHH